MLTDRAFCRDLGHLPRGIYTHPTNRNLTLELCLRCGAQIERSRWTGEEFEFEAGHQFFRDLVLGS